MRRIRSSAVALLLAAGAGAQEQPAELAQRAVRLQQAGDNAGAAEAYRALLRATPDDVATHVNLGVVLVKLKRFDEAMAEYEAADRLLPGDSRIALNIALALQKSGRMGQAAKRLEALHAEHPENSQVTMLLADCRLQAGENKSVIALLEPLSRESESDLGIAYMLGLALLREGRVAEGQVQLDRILRRGDTAEAHYLLGTRMFEARDYAAAVRELAKAAEIDPALEQVQSLYGRALLNTGDRDGARAAFVKELAANENDYDANSGLGEIYVSQHQYAAAIPVLRRAAAMRPGASDVEAALAQALAGTGRYQDAVAHAEVSVQANPNSIEAHEAVAATAAGLGRKAEADRERRTVSDLRRKQEEAPHTGDAAPEFALTAADGREVQLSDYRGRTPVVLVFGSYSCPNLRSSAEPLRLAQKRYGERAAFLLVYIREAHTGSTWESTRNEREGVTSSEATTMEQREQNARACSRNLHLPFRAIADAMDGRTEAAYHAWPSRAFVIDRTGRITYSTRLTDFDFRAEDFRQALSRVVR